MKLSSQEIERLLNGIDFLAIKDFFALAKSEGKEHPVTTDVDKAVDHFISNPSKKTAVALLKKYPHLKDIFEASKTVSH